MLATHERFDLNNATVNGVVQKVRPFGHGTIMIHLDKPRAAIALPEGSEEVSLAAGDNLAVTGWLKDVPFEEGLSNFLARAGRLDLLEKYPSLAAIKNKTVARSLTAIIPDGAFAVEEDEQDDPNNYVRVEGVVVRAWVYSRHTYTRLAVYDRYEKDLDQAGDDGKLPRRKAHYVTVQFTDGMVDGRKVALKPKTRLRVSGRLATRVYVETLREWLNQAKLAEFIQSFENPDLLGSVRARYGQVVVEAGRLIVFN
jgi:hypothetical protein